MKNKLIKSLLKDLGPIIFRNVFSLVVLIIGGLSLVLILLGDYRDGVFLGSVITVNIIVGIVQELRAKYKLEKLQLGAKKRYDVERGGERIKIFAEDIKLNDKILLSLGDQIPVDSAVLDSESFECNFALLTGESENINKEIGDKLISGGIVVAGSATIKATATEKGSYLYKMNESLKKYETSYSPIQRDILKFIKIMALILLLLGLIIITRSIILEGSILKGFVQVAALASTIIAEGLLLASTLLFAYGAIRMAQQKVLVQQINSIENLGRVSVVCIDKTGTITESSPVYEDSVLFSPKDKSYFDKIISSYISEETSKTTTIQALENHFSSKNKLAVDKFLAFSSARKYSALKLKNKKVIIIGAGDKFIKYLNDAEKKWAVENINQHSRLAKRIIFVAEVEMSDVENPETVKNMRAIGLVIFSNPLKKGSKETIKSLQSRGIQVIVISGDSPETVRAIANRAGVDHSDNILSGDELIKIKQDDLISAINSKSLFARVLPEQKQMIIDAIKASKKSVAMIGDGANDAMAIKSSDIGIAMFDGAPATRQIADMVLINNSFSAIPRGIKLSDAIITTLEMIGCLFFTRVWSGVFLLLITLLINIQYPLYPRNITLLNLFIVTIPIIFWLAYPRYRKRSLDDPSYLTRTLPFSILNSLTIALSSLLAIIFTGLLNINSNQIPMMVFIIFFIMSIYSIGLIPRAIGAEQDKTQQRIIYSGYLIAAGVLVLIYIIEPLSSFFSLGRIQLETLILALVFGYSGTALQYLFARYKFANKLWGLIKK